MGIFVNPDEEFCDSSCLILLRPAFRFAADWALLQRDEHPIGDFAMWVRILGSGLPRAHSRLYTVAYTATHAAAYHMLGWPVPEGASRSVAITEAKAKWAEKGNPPYPSSLDVASSPQHCNDCGLAWAALEEWDEALKAYDRALKLDPTYAAAHDNRRRALAALGRQDEARLSLERALALDPSSS